MDKHRFQELLLKYKANLLSGQEWEELQALARDAGNEQLLADDFTNLLQTAETHPSWNPQKEERLLRGLKEQLWIETPIPRTNRIIWRRIAAVAAVLVVCIAGVYLIGHKTPDPSASTLASIPPSPGKDYATLTLANGQKIALDTNTTGLVAKENGTTVVNLKGCLSYSGPGHAGEVTYNTIETGRGNQYQLILPDGSKVWLNAASSLRFPTVFSGNERKVTLTGEGYFDIAQNADQVFIVTFDNTEVQVLGTEFNIMAYADEPAEKATLIKGKIALRKGTQKTLLQPGSEGVITTDGIVVKEADTDQAAAWKNGRISFTNADMDVIMRQIGRWYDVDISFKGNIPKKRFFGLLDRNVPLATILEFLAERGIHSTIEGKRVTLYSKQKN